MGSEKNGLTSAFHSLHFPALLPPRIRFFALLAAVAAAMADQGSAPVSKWLKPAARVMAT